MENLDFGTNTWDLDEKFEAPREEHEFYKGETFSLSKPWRLGGLAPFEKQMIGQAVKIENASASADEKLKEFSQTDGTLTYFSHKPSGRQFVQVAHFPGDNEFGLVFEIETSETRTKIAGVVRKIEDGAFAPLPG